METSGFSDTQLDVRDAIAKVCSNFPDVSWDSCIREAFVEYFYCRNIGHSMMSQENIPMNCTQLWQKMVGLGLPFQKN
jgi:hypothetical protein